MREQVSQAVQPAALDLFSGGVYERAHIKGVFRVDKYYAKEDGSPDFERGAYESVEVENLLITAGINKMLRLLGNLDTTGQFGTGAYMGVADGTNAVAASDADVQTTGANKAYQQVAGAPTVTNNQIVWTATFASAAAAFAWNNVGLFNASMPGGTMLSHVQQALGTKTNSVAWTLTYTITIS